MQKERKEMGEIKTWKEWVKKDRDYRKKETDKGVKEFKVGR